jgi:methylmalonyl-CoA/ethylmalonyl-CoA epimerase
MAYDHAPEKRAFQAIGLDHVALSAADAVGTGQRFSDVLGLRADAARDALSQPLRLVRLPAGNAFLSITQPLSDEHRVARTMSERGQGMYAIGITVDNIDDAVRDLRAKGIYVSDVEYGLWPGTRTARVNPAAANDVNIMLVEQRPDLA